MFQSTHWGLFILLQVQTELAYLSQHRNELIRQKGHEQITQRHQLTKLQDERDQLKKLHENLMRQLEIMQNSDRSDQRHPSHGNDDDEWEFLPQEQ